jgi:hypothetical protein
MKSEDDARINNKLDDIEELIREYRSSIDVSMAKKIENILNSTYLDIEKTVK